MVFGRAICGAFLLFAAVIAVAQGHDQHVTQDPAQKLFAASPFAHGYMHGYEMGYHCGDLDLQLAHGTQEMKNEKHYKDAGKQYRKEFGDKDSFVQGYQAGFRIGYADGYQGIDFHAVQNLRQLSQDMPEFDPHASPILDQALLKGYDDGRKNGLGDGRANADYRPDGSDCELALRFKEAPAKFYCSAYSLGYRFGYSDGFRNQRKEPPARHVAGVQ